MDKFFKNACKFASQKQMSITEIKYNRLNIIYMSHEFIYFIQWLKGYSSPMDILGTYSNTITAAFVLFDGKCLQLTLQKRLKLQSSAVH